MDMRLQRPWKRRDVDLGRFSYESSISKVFIASLFTPLLRAFLFRHFFLLFLFIHFLTPRGAARTDLNDQGQRVKGKCDNLKIEGGGVLTSHLGKFCKIY